MNGAAFIGILWMMAMGIWFLRIVIKANRTEPEIHTPRWWERGAA
jgi:hypothetical protein